MDKPKPRPMADEDNASIHVKLDGIINSMNFQSEKYDDLIAENKKITDKLDQLVSEIKGLKIENEKLRRENATLKVDLDNLTEEHNILEQYNRGFNLEFHGITKSTDKEDTTDIILKICKAMDIDIASVDIENSHRLPVATNDRPRQMSKSTPPPIIARFYSRNLKNEILQQKKAFPNLNTNDVGLQDGNKIYINENLTKRNKTLFWMARNTKKLGYQYVWTKNGKIFIRRDNAAPIIKVTKVSDIPVK